MKKEDKEVERAVKAIDKMEDRAAHRKKGKTERIVIICPKCERPVTEEDFIDKFSEAMGESFTSKITCPKCGYAGLPVEVDAKKFEDILEGKKPVK